MYYVQYIDLCTPKLKEFKTKSEAKNFISKFTQEAPNNQDFWIEAFYKGKIDTIFQCDDAWDNSFFREGTSAGVMKHD